MEIKTAYYYHFWKCILSVQPYMNKITNSLKNLIPYLRDLTQDLYRTVFIHNATSAFIL